MNPKLLLKSRLFYFGVLIFITGIIVGSISGKSELLGACLAQGGIIMCFLAYNKVKAIKNEQSPTCSHQEQKYQKSIAIGGTVVCVCFMLSPIVLWPIISKMQGVLFWYLIATGMVGVFGCCWFYCDEQDERLGWEHYGARKP
jgi:drug/metabolite transporter (DMT)-like permease